MSAPILRAYDFRTAEQWGACLTKGLRADGHALAGFAPLASSQAADAPARLVARLADGELLWIDLAGRLHVESCEGSPLHVAPAPCVLAGATRIAALRGALWALAADGVLARLSAASFQTVQRFAPADLDADEILDLAGDRREGIEILIRAADGVRRMAWSARKGRFRPGPLLPPGARRLAVLREPRLAVVQLARTLRFLPQEGAAFDVALAALAPGLSPVALASDGRDSVLLATVTPTAQGWRRRVLVLDRHGEAATVLELGYAEDEAWTPGLAAAGGKIWMADETGLRVFAPDPRGASQAILTTPLLVSPELAERGWLRAEIEGDLPPGARLTVSCASSSDATLRGALAVILADPATSPGVKRGLLEQQLAGLWRTCATIEAQADDPPRLIAPLYAAAGAALVLKLELDHAGGAAPRLKRLRVIYPELSLTRSLPAIFRGPAGDANGFLRKIVAVLEATTQDLDDRIATLGRLADPGAAPDDWLDFLAGWFGGPWRPDLQTAAKRRLLQAMPKLLRSRGTRQGLRDLFEAILPGAPVAITDTAVDLRPAVLGSGVALPAILLGRPKGLAGLGEARARLGHMRLKCADEVEDPLARLEGVVRIVLTLGLDQRRVWAPILAALAPDFIPAGMALDLRFRPALPEGLGRRLDDTLRLGGLPRAVLGADGVPIGRARLGGEGPDLADGALAGGVRLN